MAKKTSKKAPAKKPAAKSPGKKAAPSKPAGKPASKSASKSAGKSAGKSAKSGGWPGSPKPIGTGKGPSPREIGQGLVAMFNRAKFKEIEDAYWSPGIESIEGSTPESPGMIWKGRANVEAKGAFWSSMNSIRGASAEGPFVGSTGFAVKFRMDVEEKATLRRFVMEEVGVYTVKDGKIIREEFMYGSMTPVASAAPSES